MRVVLNNPKFKTLRCIVNFDLETSKKLAVKREVKIGYKICPAIKTVKVIQCTDFYMLGHNEKDREGKLICTNIAVCKWCSREHDNNVRCEAKENESRLCCVNCKDKHRADDFKCKKIVEKKEEMLNKCIC